MCHHSLYHKVDKESNKRGLSKNTSCKAQVKFVIKIDTVSTRKTDPFVKVKYVYSDFLWQLFKFCINLN